MFNWLQLGHVATASCKQSEFPAFLALVVGGGEERFENEGEQVVVQPVNNAGYPFQAGFHFWVSLSY